MISKEEWTKTLAQRHGAERQRCFEAATVAICGLGGLGSNVALALARAGIGKLVLIDFDRVDLSNLHRQQYALSQIGQYKTEALAENLRALNPFMAIETHTLALTAENALPLLQGADIVCEAFDRAEAKAMLVNLLAETLPDKFLVAASGMAGFGEANAIRTRKITEHFYLCGDQVSEVIDGCGLAASRVMLCAAHQAHAILRILLKEGCIDE